MTKLVLVLAVIVAIVGAGSGAAANSPFTPAPVATPLQPDPVRDNGHGDWFRHVCDVPDGALAGCGAQVVSNSGGTPLASTTPPSAAYGPAQFHTAYNLPTGPSTQTIGIVDAYDDPTIESDLAAYDSYYSLPACTTANGCFQKVNQSGGTTYPSGNSWHLEIALDVETAHEICQTCKILLVEATNNSLANLGAAVNEAVALGASAVSNSYGASEYSSETSDESAYFKHPGVAITASAGDGGYGVEFPAASQYVTAVGGTTLHLNSNNTYQSESVWSGTGSGCSKYEPKPAWQTDTGCSKRTVADVSADADPNTGAAIYDSVGTSGGAAWYQVGGTSLSSPLVAAVYALADNSSVTYGSTPYSHAGLLHDVTSGSNGSCGGSYLCTAGTGYDGPTGLGTPSGTGAFTATTQTPGFTLGVSPSSRTVAPGGSATYTVTVNGTGGFSGSVSLGASGLPTGASASFSPNPTTGSSTMTVTTAGTTPNGTSTITITGTSGSLTASTTATLTVQQVQSFTLGVTPSSQTVAPGGSTTYAIAVNGSGGFAGSVSLSATGLPSGAHASFSPNPATGSSTLSVTTATNTPNGTSTITITGTSGSLSAKAAATLQVLTPSFTLSASPPSQTVTAGGSASYSVTVNPANGFAGAVSLSASGLPGGAKASFSPNPATGTSTMTVTTASNTPGGASTIAIKGTNGSISGATTVTLSVVVPSFTLSVSPSSQTVSAGGGTTYTVTVNPVNGFSASVNLQTNGLPGGVHASFSPNPATGTSTMTVTTDKTVHSGSTTITVKGSSGSISATATATLVVAAH